MLFGGWYARGMAHIHRFYIPPETDSGGEIVLAGDEAHHALRVVRMRVGDPVVLLDGAGREITGTVLDLLRREVRIQPDHERREALPGVCLTVVQASLHRDKTLESLIEHGTEVGVHRFVIFRGQRSERPAQLGERWRRIAMEVCKQSGRLWLPLFETAESLEVAIGRPYDTLLFATRDRTPTPLGQIAFGMETALVVGPEGDFADEELGLLAGHGGVPISLGPRVFRAEFAAVLASALTLYEAGQLGPK